MLCLLLLATLAQDPLRLDEEVGQPHLPGPEWTRLDPGTIESLPAYLKFPDAFTAAPEHAWAESPAARGYGVGTELPAAWTSAALLGELVGLGQRLAGSSTFAGDNGPRLREHLTRELDRLVEGLSVVAADVGMETQLDWPTVAGLVDERFQPASWSGADAEGPVVTDSLFFGGRDTQVMLRLDRKPALGGATPLAYFATPAQAVEFRAVCARVTALFSVVVQAELERAALRLGEIDAGWTNYLEHGFSQYPWESWANGWLTDFSWTRPPRSQWVLLHPELGLIFDTRSSRSAEMQAALLVHGVGYVRYFGDERDWFVGLSATASITDDASYGWGFGPTVHFGHTRLASRVPHVSVSVLWQDFEDGDDGPVVAATLDLWRLVDRGSEMLYQSRLLH